MDLEDVHVEEEEVDQRTRVPLMRSVQNEQISRNRGWPRRRSWPVQETQEARFRPWIGKTPWRRAGQPTAAVLPGESHGQRSLEGYGP